MVLPQSGNPISLLNLQLEYDDTPPTALSEMYNKANAPASGTIDLADFYGAASTAAVTTNLLFELDARNTSSWSGSGTTWYDTTSNSYDFSLVNGPTGTTNAIDFDGTNDYAQIADGTWIPDGTNAWTCECYVNIDSWARGSFAANERLMFSKTSPSNQGMSVGFEEESNGNLSMSAATQGGGNVDWASEKYNMGAASSYTGTYFHAVWTYDGSVLKYYINGSLVRTSASGKNFHANTAPLRLFSLDPSNGSYIFAVDGKFRVARMYSSALSASNVTTNYNNCTGGIAPVASVLTVTPGSHSGSAFTATFTFDQNVGLFDTNDVTVSNGSKGTFTAVSKKVYTLVITPSSSSSTVTIAVATGASTNAGNLGNNAISLSVPYSTLATSGLVVHLDASDSSSYSGSGSTWTDISGSGTTYNATLYNSPTYVSSGTKHFSFDGSNDYANMSRSVSDDFSLGIWFNTTVNSGNGNNQWWSGRGMLDGEVGGTTNDFGMTMGAGIVMFGTGQPDTTIRSTSTLNDGNWHYALATRTKSTGAIQLYIDGSLDASTTTSNTSSLTAPTYITIGRLQAGGDYWQGKVSKVHIYNRVLTSTEVATNYSAGA